MKRVDLVKKGEQWVQESRGESRPLSRLKKDAITKAAQAARRAREAVTLKIHKEDGRIQEERTYPRAADPRTSKG